MLATKRMSACLGICDYFNDYFTCAFPSECFDSLFLTACHISRHAEFQRRASAGLSISFPSMCPLPIRTKGWRTMNAAGSRVPITQEDPQAATPHGAPEGSPALHPLPWHRSVVDVHLLADRIHREDALPNTWHAKLQVWVCSASGS